jgi:hypothetical protein
MADLHDDVLLAPLRDHPCPNLARVVLGTSPNITAILQRLTGEWAALLQPDAILAARGEVGYTRWHGHGFTPVTTMQIFLVQILASQPLTPSCLAWDDGVCARRAKLLLTLCMNNHPCV